MIIRNEVRRFYRIWVIIRAMTSQYGDLKIRTVHI
jgi:hypothetical protein